MDKKIIEAIIFISVFILGMIAGYAISMETAHKKAYVWYKDAINEYRESGLNNYHSINLSKLGVHPDGNT